jgi:hypothetical protein
MNMSSVRKEEENMLFKFGTRLVCITDGETPHKCPNCYYY